MPTDAFRQTCGARARGANRRAAGYGITERITADDVEAVLRAHSECTYCGASENLTVDHTVALISGGMNARENLQVCCRRCNNSKGDGQHPAFLGTRRSGYTRDMNDPYTHALIEDWRAGKTIVEMAKARGVSKQAISKRLLRMGYSPKERRYAEQAAEGSQASAVALDKLTARAEAREAAARRLVALADELDMSPRALAVIGQGDGDLAERVREACGEFSADYLAHVVPG